MNIMRAIALAAMIDDTRAMVVYDGLWGQAPSPHLSLRVVDLLWRLCRLCGAMWGYIVMSCFPDAPSPISSPTSSSLRGSTIGPPCPGQGASMLQIRKETPLSCMHEYTCNCPIPTERQKGRPNSTSQVVDLQSKFFGFAITVLSVNFPSELIVWWVKIR